MLTGSNTAPSYAATGFIRSFSFVILVILALGSIASTYIHAVRHHDTTELIVTTTVSLVAAIVIGLCLRSIHKVPAGEARGQQIIVIAILFAIFALGLVRDLLRLMT